MQEPVKAMRESGRTYLEIAELTDQSISSIKSYCHRNKIRSIVYVRCLSCGKPLVQIAGYKRRKFCCTACKNHWWNANRKWAKRERD